MEISCIVGGVEIGSSPSPGAAGARGALSHDSGRGRVPPRVGAGGGRRVASDATEPGGVGGELTRVGTAPPQPTCPPDLKLGGGAPRAARPGPGGTARAPRAALSPEMPAAAEMPAPPPPPPLLLLLLLLACCAGTCPGAPVLSQGLQPEQEPQLWNEIRDACSAFLSLDSQPQAPNALKELCITIMGTLPKPQETDEKDNTKRFLFHYSKTRKLGNSNVVSSVLHPLLQLVPQLHERRMKRFRLDEEFQGPIASQVRRQFLFRPRNGRRSEGYI
ncbi:neuromedin-U [Canis lupus dingo]|uniref:neuromedin-U n=1 Tax=Canis lupus dingo TaxID=286419 RepID=UPI0020C3AE27|nr:neuromedin-U [Canis lupus dingo]